MLVRVPLESVERIPSPGEGDAGPANQIDARPGRAAGLNYSKEGTCLSESANQRRRQMSPDITSVNQTGLSHTSPCPETHG